MSSMKPLYYIGGFTLAGYFLMKAVERDPESLRKELALKHGEDYQAEVNKQNAQFMTLLKSVSQGADPVATANQLKEQDKRLKLKRQEELQKLKEQENLEAKENQSK
ncbi:hypothetical protein SK128_019783 [Halocaridina rubra]|uniref:Uncharacterized protein n=1 Tax=Halocaridina rubra TaxID=373956 RepID=A0AAN8WR94_HALRR